MSHKLAYGNYFVSSNMSHIVNIFLNPFKKFVIVLNGFPDKLQDFTCVRLTTFPMVMVFVATNPARFVA